MTLQETRARRAAAAATLAARLRANARTARPLPLDVREEIAALASSGMPQVAVLALDAVLAVQEVAHV